ncbi:MAG TPA: ribonuclease H [Egibacteraceae bacterium]|nr:ribonuclease H [Egibacteraceae bacterium]
MASTCVTCGAAFTVPARVRERYPGWTPKQCRACHGGAPGGAGGGAVEENLPLAEVLAKFTGGPQDGVFTDGSANPNPGPGGWGAVYVDGGEVVDQAHGHDPRTTNNRMELTALIAGYDLVPEGVVTTVYTDSRLCVDTITKWAPVWERRGWTRKTGPIANLDLVRELYERARARPELRLEWIAAHAGARWNEYADSLSTAYRRAEL